MASPPSYDDRPPRRPQVHQPPPFRISPLWLGVLVLPILAVLGVSYWWFGMRIEVPPNHVLVLTRNIGENIETRIESAEGEGPQGAASFVGGPTTQLVLYPGLLAALGEAPGSARFKGVQYEVLEEGRHFRDPFLWWREIRPAVIIEQGEVGVKVRRYGRPLPVGKVVATEPDERGPLAEVLMPGRYNLNPYAYQIVRVAPITVPLGYVGVQTLYHGADPVSPNQFVVNTGERGVQPDVLPPGLYYNNPYVRRIDLVDVRSHTLDLRGNDVIRFPSSDSFDIIIETTVEYAISQDRAAYVTVAIGTHEDIEEKLILPHARSLSRIEGSKLLAKQFISGESRLVFQDAFFEGLRDQCNKQGIEIRATLIRRIEPPAEIANPISDRQIAEQQIAQYGKEIEAAESQARLVEQTELQKQNQALGAANRDVVTMIVDAQQRKAVALTEANKRLEVARLRLAAAEEQATATLARGRAAAEIVLLQYQAEAEPLRSAVAAFGGGHTYAQYFFYEKLAPALKSVLASTDGPFADVFRALGDVSPGATPVPRLEPAAAVMTGGAE